MEQKEIVSIRSGLHGRAAAFFVQTASKFTSDIKLISKELTADAKSIMGVIALNLAYGDEATIKAVGEDAHRAIEQLQQVLKTDNFIEE